MIKCDKEIFAQLFQGGDVPMMLEDGRMGLCSHVNDTHALVDVYRGNDHEGMLHIPYGNIVLVGGRAIAGLKGVDRSEDAAYGTRLLIPDEVLEGSAVQMLMRGEKLP